MRQRLPALSNGQIQIKYFKTSSTEADGSCVADDALNACRNVRVSIVGFTYTMPMLVASLSFSVPSFRTTLAREVMRSTDNPACQP
jgi:hypothetical protein